MGTAQWLFMEPNTSAPSTLQPTLTGTKHHARIIDVVCLPAAEATENRLDSRIPSRGPHQMQNIL